MWSVEVTKDQDGKVSDGCGDEAWTFSFLH